MVQPLRLLPILQLGLSLICLVGLAILLRLEIEELYTFSNCES